MQPYDAARFDPAAPIAFVTVKAEQLGTVRDVLISCLIRGCITSSSILCRSWFRLIPRSMSFKHSTEPKVWRTPLRRN